MFDRVLIANRGEIAVRIQRTLKRLGVESIAVYSDPDRDARHVLNADHAVALGGSSAAESYLNTEAVLAAARGLATDSAGQPLKIGIHPGYGFLSENAEFAEACEREGFVFIGPTPAQLRDFGLKHTARELAKSSQVPLLPGSDLLPDAAAALARADQIGYPVMLKSTAGGGGIGMRLCANAGELEPAFETVRDLGRRNFADDGIYIEKFVERARHVEVQIFGDGQGRVIALGERDCSVQRRNQKVIEETPAPALPDELRTALRTAAMSLGRSVQYRSAGTVEFVYDPGGAYFLEVNTRLQVEHGVTENVYGVDLVEWMIRLAAGESEFLNAPNIAKIQALAESDGPATPPDPARAYSVQARIYAEDPVKNFQPGAGLLNHVEFPEGEDLRIDTYIESGSVVSPHYAPLLAKLMVTGPDRESVRKRLAEALSQPKIYGIETNLEFLEAIVRGDALRDAQVYTRMLNDFAYASRSVDVLQGGPQTTVQDYPGRMGYWSVGVPPSGPMDALSFRLGNRLLGNADDAAGLEMTVSGATLTFQSAARVCLCGAAMTARLQSGSGDELLLKEVPFWTELHIPAGATLKIGALQEKAAGSGQRSYLLFAGGLDVAPYLGSRSTFTLGEFGGHAGRALATGDVLRLHADPAAKTGDAIAGVSVPAALRPDFGQTAAVWTIGALIGPHSAPDFFKREDVETILNTDYEVHYNSARTGVRLIGPRPEWARPDGGEAGLHPSNIHDNAYAFGTLDFTGDMPIILGPDGPSLGGFVCPLTIAEAELWKTGQLRPGDRVRFVIWSAEEADAAKAAQDHAVRQLRADAAAASAPAHSFAAHLNDSSRDPAIVWEIDAPAESDDRVVVRRAGERFVLIEFGPPVLDIRLRFRAHALMNDLQKLRSAGQLRGIVDLTPGIRSLQIQLDSRETTVAQLLPRLIEAANASGGEGQGSVPSRSVHLPLAWNDPSTQEATRKYMQSVWADAPWCPDNLEFIRRINGLPDIDAVQRTVFDASYLVLGLGDVYLGAPVATPLDPRHRLVTTKYNPARTWTPQNAVGIGGAYLCVYGMEGPGGYQFVGRTCQVWNTYRQTDEFGAGSPYLLRFFDELRFDPVSPAELLDFRADFLTGRASLKIEEHRFDLAAYQRFLSENAESIADFRTQQQRAFGLERERWKSLSPPDPEASAAAAAAAEESLGEDQSAVESPMHGNVWKLLVEPGSRIRAGDEVLVLEAMKMEVAVQADESGTVAEVLCAAGDGVRPGQRLLVLNTADDTDSDTESGAGAAS